MGTMFLRSILSISLNMIDYFNERVTCNTVGKLVLAFLIKIMKTEASLA
ncbi:hypothetical protein L3N51_02467 [Metallosphaera sp. J1]|nr:hypothetical protein [Metallosphaera javensis (ex Hofmann et al. 2022)]